MPVKTVVSVAFATLKGGVRPTRAPEDTDQLARAAAIVADWDHVAERAVVRFAELVEDFDEAVGRAAAGEDDDAVAGERWEGGRSRAFGRVGWEGESPLPAVCEVVGGHFRCCSNAIGFHTISSGYLCVCAS